MSNNAKGFVTIATGEDRYYQIALNLLRSYQLFCPEEERLPWAIICEKENEYTKEFDDVICLEKAYKSYLDKIQLLNHVPYKETVFVESDILAYANLNRYFDVFKDSSDFSVFGEIHPISTETGGWFKLDETGKYRDEIEFIPNFHSGIIYLRQGSICSKMYDICVDVIGHFEDYMIGGSRDAMDDKVFALASAVTGCKPTKNNGGMFCYYPWCIQKGRKPRPQMYKKQCSFEDENKNRHPAMVCHWANVMTRHYLYQREVASMMMLRNNTNIRKYVQSSVIQFIFYKCWERWFLIYKPAFMERVTSNQMLKNIWHRLKQ
jgi:hypothetical protein